MILECNNPALGIYELYEREIERGGRERERERERESVCNNPVLGISELYEIYIDNSETGRIEENKIVLS